MNRLYVLVVQLACYNLFFVGLALFKFYSLSGQVLFRVLFFEEGTIGNLLMLLNITHDHIFIFSRYIVIYILTAVVVIRFARLLLYCCEYILMVHF